jgi:hypothetical protein
MMLWAMLHVPDENEMAIPMATFMDDRNLP